MSVTVKNEAEVELSWPLLKQGESITVSTVCAVAKGSILRRSEIGFEERMVDVDSKPITRPILAWAVGAYLVLAVTVGSAIIWSEGFEARVFYSGQGISGPLITSNTNDDLFVCEQAGSMFAIRKCVALPENGGDNYDLAIGRYTIGIKESSIYAVLALVAIYVFPLALLYKFTDFIRENTSLRRRIRTAFRMDPPV